MATIAAPSLSPPLPPPPALPATATLFLDFDGTLVPIAERPDHIEVHPELPLLLEGLRGRLGGALAIITGRRLEDVDRRLAPFAFSGAGLHGAELRPAAGGAVQLQWNPDTRALIEALRRRFADDPRILVEDKAACVAVHFRQAPERAQECRDALHALAHQAEFEIIAGKMVVEARPPGTGKGRALAALLQHPPFRGRQPVFVGDDVTDEEGFAAAAELGGWGVKIGPGPTLARYRFDDAGALAHWLRAALADDT